ncbi:MAG: helix-turn-helix transcriptional regulator [Clostridiaceae bacterium]|jgi:DNA-binding PadR family transcriptional regulator|nr:helix-turn-helix transcriptional regulator [Clostridiaceae bacterium]
MDISTVNSDILRGNVNTIILSSLLEGAGYCYDILREIELKSDGQYRLKQATLYSCLKRLEQRGLVYSYLGELDDTGGGRRRYYKLTEEGQLYFEQTKNEYVFSRTILDKLVSDDDFDFTNPVPFDPDSLRPYTKRKGARDDDISDFSGGATETERIVEREIIREVPVEHEIIKEVTIEVESIREVPVEVVREVRVIVETAVPVESVREIIREIEIDRLVEVTKEIEIIREVAVDRPVEVIREIVVDRPVEVVREVPIDRPVEVIREVPVDRPVEIIREVVVDRPVEVFREVAIDRPVEVIREVPVDRPVEIIREIVVDRPVEVVREVAIDRPVEVIREVIVDRPVEIIREIVVDRPVEVLREVAIDRPVEVEREVFVKYDGEVSEIIKEVPFQVESIKEIYVPVETIREIETVREVAVDRPVEIIREIEILRPVEVVKNVEIVREVEVEKPVAIIVETAVEVIREVPVEVPVSVETFRETQVERVTEVLKEIEIFKEIPVKVVEEVEIIREVEIERPVANFCEIDKIVRVPFEIFKEVEILRETEAIRTVEIIKEIQVEVIKEVPVEIYREVPYYIDRIVEKPVYIEVPVLFAAEPPVAETVNDNAAAAFKKEGRRAGRGKSDFTESYAADAEEVEEEVIALDVLSDEEADDAFGMYDEVSEDVEQIKLDRDKEALRRRKEALGFAGDDTEESDLEARNTKRGRSFGRKNRAAALRNDGGATAIYYGDGFPPFADETAAVLSDTVEFAAKNGNGYLDFFADVLDETKGAVENDSDKNDGGSSQFDLKMRLYASGFLMKTYVKSQSRDYFESSFILKFKLWRDCGFFMMLFLCAGIGLFWGLSGVGDTNLYAALFGAAAVMFVAPLTLWLFNPGKRGRAEYNFKSSLLLRAIIYIEAAVAAVFIAFYAIGINIEDTQSLYLPLFLPLALLTVIPFGALFRLCLGKLKRYSIKYSK